MAKGWKDQLDKEKQKAQQLTQKMNRLKKRVERKDKSITNLQNQ